MSARDDLVAAMEAHEAWMNSTSDKYAEWDKCVAGALTVIRKHGPALLALLDAEPVAWAVMNADGEPLDLLYGPCKHGRKTVALYARPQEASDE